MDPNDWETNFQGVATLKLFVDKRQNRNGGDPTVLFMNTDPSVTPQVTFT